MFYVTVQVMTATSPMVVLPIEVDPTDPDSSTLDPTDLATSTLNLPSAVHPTDPASSTLDTTDPATSTLDIPSAVDPADPASLTLDLSSMVDPNGPASSTLDPTDLATSTLNLPSAVHPTDPVSLTLDLLSEVDPTDPASSTLDPTDPATSTLDLPSVVDPNGPAISTLDPTDPATSTLDLPSVVDPNDPDSSTLDPLGWMELSTIDEATLWSFVSCGASTPTDGPVSELTTPESISVSNTARLTLDPVVLAHDPANVCAFDRSTDDPISENSTCHGQFFGDFVHDDNDNPLLLSTDHNNLVDDVVSAVRCDVISDCSCDDSVIQPAVKSRQAIVHKRRQVNRIRSPSTSSGEEANEQNSEPKRKSRKRQVILNNGSQIGAKDAEIVENRTGQAREK